MRLLLDHPAVRDARSVYLTTRDADRFYERMGFVERSRAPTRPWTQIHMVLHREPSAPQSSPHCTSSVR
jgi:hypothetical protein